MEKIFVCPGDELLEVSLFLKAIQHFELMKSVLLLGDLEDESGALVEDSFTPMIQIYRTRRTRVEIFYTVYFE